MSEANQTEIESHEAADVPAFEEMTPVDADGTWLTENGTLPVGVPLVGTLLDVEEDVGEFGSRMYRVQLAESVEDLVPGDVALFWGAASLDQKVDRGGIGRGRIIGVCRTEETYETDEGNEGHVFDVRTMEV